MIKILSYVRKPLANNSIFENRSRKIKFLSSLFRFEKKKKRKEKLGRNGTSLFFTFSQSCTLLQKGIKKKKIFGMKSIFTNTQRNSRLENCSCWKIFSYTKKSRKRRYMYAHKPLRFPNNLKSWMRVHETASNEYSGLFSNREILGREK